MTNIGNTQTFWLFRVVVVDRGIDGSPTNNGKTLHVVAIEAHTAIDRALQLANERRHTSGMRSSSFDVAACERLIVIDDVTTSVITDARMREAARGDATPEAS